MSMIGPSLTPQPQWSLRVLMSLYPLCGPLFPHQRNEQLGMALPTQGLWRSLLSFEPMAQHSVLVIHPLELQAALGFTSWLSSCGRPCYILFNSLDKLWQSSAECRVGTKKNGVYPRSLLSHVSYYLLTLRVPFKPQMLDLRGLKSSQFTYQTPDFCLPWCSAAT